MDGSRALARCLEQVQISSRGCVGGHGTAEACRSLASTKQKRYRLATTSFTSRSFSTARPLSQDQKPAPTQNLQQEESRPRQPRRIDLTGIANRADYVPPPKPAARPPPKGDTVLASISHLLKKHDEKINPRNSANSLYNNNIYGAGGTFASRARTPTKPSSQDPNAPLSMHSIVGLPKNKSGLSVEDMEVEEKRPLRFKPTLGRGVPVDAEKNMDLTRAFVTLEMKINGRGNAVRRDERGQKFHVRRGQAKKIKRRERWRIMFKEGFLAECARVRKMIRQGW